TDDHRLRNLPRGYGFFSYARDPQIIDLRSVLERSIHAANRVVGEVHGVVMPELALMEEELGEVRDICDENGLILISGVAGRRDGRERNYCLVRAGVEYEQDKHHRWCLDTTQIRTYGLGARLSP